MASTRSRKSLSAEEIFTKTCADTLFDVQSVGSLKVVMITLTMKVIVILILKLQEK
jgi:hypothetical protein